MVKLNGEPLSGAIVTLMPKSGTAGTECIGVTDEAGRYQVKQVHGDDGAAPGDYTVIISHMVMPNGEPYAQDNPEPPVNVGAIESLPLKYSSLESELSATVPPSGGEFPFDLKK